MENNDEIRWQQRFENERQNRCLAGLRDTLLPKFMSGEIEMFAAIITALRESEITNVNPMSASVHCVN